MPMMMSLVVIVNTFVCFYHLEGICSHCLFCVVHAIIKLIYTPLIGHYLILMIRCIQLKIEVTCVTSIAIQQSCKICNPTNCGKRVGLRMRIPAGESLLLLIQFCSQVYTTADWSELDKLNMGTMECYYTRFRVVVLTMAGLIYWLEFQVVR